MKLWTFARSRLARKLLLSHLVIILMAGAVLGAVSSLHAPTAFSHHVSRMQEAVGADAAVVDDLRRNFLAAIAEILAVAGAAAATAALAVSSFVAWRIIGPIRMLTEATKRIADGDYGRRVAVVWNDELSELAQSFNRMAGALQDTEKRRVELIGNVAHELKTPLTTIRGTMEAIIDGVLPADDETLLEMQRETARLQRLTDEMLELSRTEAGVVDLRLEVTDAVEILRRAASRLHPQFQDKGVSLRMELAEQPLFVSVDGERMMQVFINLIGNALQFTPPGGSVTIRGRERAGQTIFSVTDTGIGLAADEIPRIFERFYRVEKSRSRSRGGSGIGLTIAAHLVRAHGGTLTAESRGVGFGSTFWFALPTSATAVPSS